MASYHQTTVIGNVGRDPDVKYLPSGQAALSMPVAVSEKFKGKDGEMREETTWYSVQVFGATAENCGMYLKKGSSVLVVGRMRERKYTTQANEDRRAWELMADKVQFLGSPAGAGSGASAAASARPAAAPAQNRPAVDDNVPF